MRIYAKRGEIPPRGLDSATLFDPNDSFVVRAAESESTPGYSPFEGIELQARVVPTFLHGEKVWDQSQVVGPARYRFLHRIYRKSSIENRRIVLSSRRPQRPGPASRCRRGS